MSENPIQIDVRPAGMLGANCACLIREGKAVVIDPGGDAEMIDAALAGATLSAILITHCHYDHIGGVNDLAARHPEAAIVCHGESASLIQDPVQNLSTLIAGLNFSSQPATHTITDGETFRYAGIDFRVFMIPGHCFGQAAYYVQETGHLFCGDTIFAGGIGRSDLPGGDGKALAHACRAMLESLPPETIVYPGHGSQTTAREELQNNPYL